jgi:hypothetical protein
MDLNSVTTVDAGDGTTPTMVSIREASDTWPESVMIEQDQGCVLLPSASAARRVIMAITKSARAFRRIGKQTRIGRESNSCHVFVGLGGDEDMFVYLEQEDDFVFIESLAHGEFLIEAIKAYAAVLGWEVE